MPDRKFVLDSSLVFLARLGRRLREQCCLLDGNSQTGVAGFTCSSNIKCSAVIHARADEGQTDRDVDAFIHAQTLYGDESLIMILGYHNIEPSLPGMHEDGVSRPRSTYIDAFRLRLLNRWLDYHLIFRAKETVLA